MWRETGIRRTEIRKVYKKGRKEDKKRRRKEEEGSSYSGRERGKNRDV